MQRIAESQPAWTLRRAWPEVVALGMIAAVRLWMAAWSPVIVPPDALDYINAARWLADHGSLELVPAYKSPLLAVVLGGMYAMSADGAIWLTALHAACGILASLMAWSLVGNSIGGRIGRWYGLAAGLLVGLHPVLLGYERVLLRESLAAFLLMLAAWLVAGVLRNPRISWPGVVGLGIVVAVGALLRENYQTLALLAPLVLLVIPRPANWRRRVAEAGSVVVIAALVTMPWCLRLASRHGVYGVCLPKMQFNRTLNAYNAGLIASSAPVLVPPERWSVVSDGGSRVPSDYEYVAELLIAQKVAGSAVRPTTPMARVELVLTAMCEAPRDVERACERAVDGSTDSRPRALLWHRLNAALNQLGLWRPAGLAHAKANEWVLGALMGSPTATGTGFLSDPAPALMQQRFAREPDRLQGRIDALALDATRASKSRNAKVYRAIYLTFELARPIAGVLLLVGTGAAIARRWGAGAFLGLASVVNMLGAGVVALTPWDRASAPFQGAVCVLAVYGAYWAFEKGRMKWR